MNPGNLYRAKAADMAARARADRSRGGKAEYARLSLGYLRLADQADRRTVVERTAAKEPSSKGCQSWLSKSAPVVFSTAC